MQRFNLRNLFAKKTGLRERRTKPRHHHSDNATILVADDSRTILFTLKKLLEQDGYSILVASDGMEAINIARSHSPNLILMDVIMPRINGFRATKMLKNDDLTADIPIIMMSGDEKAMQNYWINRVGARDFLNKPFRRADLFSKIEKFLCVQHLA